VSCDPWFDLPVAPVNRLDLRHAAHFIGCFSRGRGMTE
jgi:hypothetical protein